MNKPFLFWAAVSGLYAPAAMILIEVFLHH